MASKRISELSAISSLDDDDVLVIIEDGATKKVTVAELRAVLFPGWTPYTPTWTSSGTDPDIGDGSIEGGYYLRDDFLALWLSITMGSTTTYGTGTWELGLPSGYKASGPPRQAGGSVGGLDSGTSWRVGAAVAAEDATYFAVVNHGSASGWGPTAPHTWAATDAVYATAMFQVAPV